MRFAAGELIGGRYRVERELGRGGMGVVLQARDEQLGRAVALKVILPEHARDERYRQRLDREARAVARSPDPHVAALYDVESDGEVLFLVLELVPGGSLAQRAAKAGGRLPWRDVATVGSEIALGLAAVHRAGLVHRDLKPENVLLDAQGRAKLADFGIAKGTGRAEPRLSQTGDVVGTFLYMAPEQQDGGEELGPRTDLYALGATLYHLLTGRPPFEGPAFQVLKHHLVDAPAPVRTLVSDVPAPLEALVLRLLAKEPDQRGASAEEVARELRALLASPPPAPQPNRTPLVIVGLVVATGFGVAISTLAQRYGTPGTTTQGPAPPERTEPAKAPVPPAPAPGVNRPPVKSQPPAPTPKLPAGLTLSARKVPAADGKQVPLYLFQLPDGTTMEMVAVPGGRFPRGSKGPESSPEEQPTHYYEVPRDYWIGRHHSPGRSTSRSVARRTATSPGSPIGGTRSRGPRANTPS